MWSHINVALRQLALQDATFDHIADIVEQGLWESTMYEVEKVKLRFLQNFLNEMPSHKTLVSIVPDAGVYVSVVLKVGEAPIAEQIAEDKLAQKLAEPARKKSRFDLF